MIPKVSRRSAWIAVLVTVILLAAIAIIGIRTLTASVIPDKIKQQLSFVVLYPSGGGFTIDKGSWKYDNSLGLLSYLVTDKNDNAKLTISEQSSPPEFSEVPASLDTLTNKLNAYIDFDSLQGHAYLTHPAELKGGQSALMNTKGTLMFAKPNKSLNEASWRRFFNELEFIK